MQNRVAFKPKYDSCIRSINKPIKNASTGLMFELDL